MRGFVLRRLAPNAMTIKQLYSEGASFEELAQRFGCSWGTIRRFLIAEDVSLRQEPRKRKLDTFGVEVLEAFHAGAEVAEIAQRFSVQPQTVRNYLVERSALVEARAAGQDAVG